MSNIAAFETIKTDPLWYLNDEVWGIIQEYGFSDSREKPEEWKKEKEGFISKLAEMLGNKQIMLGDEPEGFNDDDRFNFRTQKWKQKPSVAVIHHTSTSPDVRLSYLNALGLMRLYVPIYRGGFNKTEKGEYKPISSGHFDQSENQVFYGYHYMIRKEGSVEQLLKNEYTGFHAGDYQTNVKSFGIAIAEDLTDKTPNESSISSLRKIIEDLKKDFSIQQVIGHKEVTHNGEKVDTECPGNTWYEWRRKVV